MDIFDQYTFEEIIKEYNKPDLTIEDYEELYIRFCHIDHLDEVKPYLFTMRFFGNGVEATPEIVMDELFRSMNGNPVLEGLYYDLQLCIDSTNSEAMVKLQKAVEAGYNKGYLKDKSHARAVVVAISAEQDASSHTDTSERQHSSQPKKNNHRVSKTTAEPEIVDEETLTKEIVLSLIKKSVNVNSNSMRTLTLPSNYNKIGSFAFQGIKEIDILNIPRGYAEIASNAFSWAVIHQVRIPDSVAVFGKNAFKGFTGVIECSSSSFAFKYAKRNNIRTLVK